MFVVETEIFSLSGVIGLDGKPRPLSADEQDPHNVKNVPDICVMIVCGDIARFLIHDDIYPFAVYPWGS